MSIKHFAETLLLLTFYSCLLASCLSEDIERRSEFTAVSGPGKYKVCSSDGVVNLRDSSLNQVLETLNNNQEVEVLGPSKSNANGTIYYQVKVTSSDLIAWSAGKLLCVSNNDSDENLMRSQMLNAGLVDVSDSIEVQLKYATSNNFLHKNVYGNFNRCFLQAEVAAKLRKAQDILKSMLAGKSTLIAYDCARPVSVQKAMWAIKPDANFVAPPDPGSKHNYGAAIDLSFRNANGDIVNMESPFDDFTARAAMDVKVCQNNPAENSLCISKVAAYCRKTLKKVMEEAGFSNYPKEWWHYDGHQNPREKYKRLNF